MKFHYFYISYKVHNSLLISFFIKLIQMMFQKKNISLMKFHIELNKTPLLLAVQNSCFEMIKLLLEQPNIEIDAKDHVQKYIK